jgi:hypothetical protein
MEYTRENKQNKLIAKQYKANVMEEQAEATEELIANLTETTRTKWRPLSRTQQKQ